MSNQGKYIYSVIREEKPKIFSDIFGMESKPVYTINHNGWGAVVSDSPLNDFLITRKFTMAHQRVMEEVMRRGYSILPVSFGTVAGSEEAIKDKVLTKKAKELEDGYKYINGRMEMNLKVLWQNVSSVFKEIAGANPIIRRAKNIAQKRPLGRFQAANIGEVVKQDLERRRAGLADKILSELKSFAVEMKEGEILQDAMVLNTTFLVPRTSGKMYDQRILELARAYSDKLNFINYGPLPPYNFVSIRVSFND